MWPIYGWMADVTLCLLVLAFANARYKKWKRSRSKARKLSLAPDGIRRSFYASWVDVVLKSGL